jgi:hypothetical protein
MSVKRQPSAHRAEHKRQPKIRVKWWKRPITWVAGVVGALVLAIATALGTGIGNSLLAAAKGHRTPTGPPVAIESVSSIQPYQDYSYVFPGKLILASSQLASVNKELGTSMSAYSHWFAEHSGVIANKGVIGITVRGNAIGRVTITDMQVVKHCAPPLTGGTLFYSPSTGAGPFTTDQIGFDLGQQVSVGQYIPAVGSHPFSPGGNFFAKKVITLKPGEPQTLSAYITAENEYCRFVFQLHAATPNGKPVAEIITDHGKPFQITTDGQEGVMGMPTTMSFSSYGVVYAGGVADRQTGHAFIRVDPSTYHGTGNPELFPPSTKS